MGAVARYDSSVYAPALWTDGDGDRPDGRTTLPDAEWLEGVYAGLGVDIGLLFETWETDDELLAEWLPSKLWRMNNLYTIIDKDGERVPFVMNKAQHKAYAALLTWYRILILKSRQQGISTFWLLCYLDDALFCTDTSVGLMAQGKGEAAKLLRRAKLAWRTLDDDVKRVLGGLGIATDRADELGFSNGSTVYISVSFRSAALQRLHVSELGKIANNFPERARELKTGTLQTVKPGCTVVIESTADGDNMFREMWDAAVDAERGGVLGPKDFKPLFLSWVYDPDCVSWKDETWGKAESEYFSKVEGALGMVLTREQKNFWIGQRRELGEDIYQEYPSTAEEAFIAVKDGTYYAKLYAERVVLAGREVEGLYDSGLSVQVAMDLGVNDTFVLIYFQRWGEEWRIIDEYYNSNESLEHYARHILASGYEITNIEVPHDVEVRDMQTLKTRWAALRSYGLENMHKVERGSLQDGIEKVRRALGRLWIDKDCVKTRRSLVEYTKEWDELNEVWKDRPKKGQANHGADAVRMMVMGRGVNSVRVDVDTRRERKRSGGRGALRRGGGFAI